jgi:hypothetical protein
MMAISEPTAHGIPEGARSAGTAESSTAPALVSVVLGGPDLPLVDFGVLKVLEEQLGRAQMARDFAEDYSELWGQRERRLVESLQGGDRTAALDAVISLKVSSAMVGGLRLARFAEALEGAVRKGDLCFGASVAAMIRGLAVTLKGRNFGGLPAGSPLRGPSAANSVSRHRLGVSGEDSRCVLGPPLVGVSDERILAVVLATDGADQISSRKDGSGRPEELMEEAEFTSRQL